MTRIGAAGRMIIVGLVALFALLAPAGSALADKLHLKDGRVLEGTIEKEIEGVGVYFVITVGKIKHTQLFTSEEIVKIERDAEEQKAAVAAAAPAVAKNAASTATDGAVRVAVLNFGPPSSWQGVIGDTVGMQISAKAFEDAIPLLEKDNVQVVVIRINSGGGLLAELERFHKVFEEKYKPRFRTVAWVESAISAAAMSPYVLEEFYFMPEGNLGACTGWRGNLEAVKDIGLEIVLYMMEEASRKGKRDPKIMRSMQIMEPLSCTIDENGEVHWFQDLSGDHIVNPEQQILTLTSIDAVRFKFARGIASNLEELCQAMGLQEWTLAGQRATEYIDKFMRDADAAEKKFDETLIKYAMAIQAAQALGGEDNRQRRGAEVGRARRYLAELERMLKINPNFEFMFPVNHNWIEEQKRVLKDLMR